MCSGTVFNGFNGLVLLLGNLAKAWSPSLGPLHPILFSTRFQKAVRCHRVSSWHRHGTLYIAFFNNSYRGIVEILLTAS